MTSGTTLRRSTVSVPPLPSPLQATRQGGAFLVPAPAPAASCQGACQGMCECTALHCCKNAGMASGVAVAQKFSKQSTQNGHTPVSAMAKSRTGPMFARLSSTLSWYRCSWLAAAGAGAGTAAPVAVAVPAGAIRAVP